MPILKRITRDQFSGFLEEFYAAPQQLRLGQSFLNQFYPNSVHPELYYNDDMAHSVEYIETHYVQPGWYDK